jgi:hypothetical protein
VEVLNFHHVCSCVHFVVKEFVVSLESTLHMGTRKIDVCLLDLKCFSERQ